MLGGVLINSVIMLILYHTSIRAILFIAFNITQGTIFQFWTLGCLRGYGVGTANGALWTIGVMVQCYFVIWILFRLLHKHGVKKWGAALEIGIALNIALPALSGIMPALAHKLLMQIFLPYIWMFILGAFINEFFEQLGKKLMKLWLPLLIASAFFSLTCFDIGRYGICKCLLLGCAVIGFGYSFPKYRSRRIYHMDSISITW